MTDEPRSAPGRSLGGRIVSDTRAWLRLPTRSACLWATLFFLLAGVLVWVRADTSIVLIFGAALACALAVDWWEGLTTALPPHLRPAPTPLPQATPAPAAPPQAAPAPDLAWPQARTRFAALRAEYAAHECDPMAVLGLPALSDVTVPSTARFVDAFTEAQALDTDAVPPASHAGAFVAAVDHAERAWQAAHHAAERIRLSHLTADDRGIVERVIKLLTTGRDSDNDAERHVAYERARSELARLDRAGVVRMPPPAQAALEAAGRGQLPA